jgi:hypothetical protein
MRETYCPVSLPHHNTCLNLVEYPLCVRSRLCVCTYVRERASVAVFDGYKLTGTLANTRGLRWIFCSTVNPPATRIYYSCENKREHVFYERRISILRGLLNLLW